MRLDRLFQALVMGGAALGLAACDSGSGSGASGGTSGGEGGAGSGGGAATGQGGAAGSGTASGGVAGEGGASTASGTGGELACSPSPIPSDPCGCPCCWVSSCLNTDPCCDSFCSLGNDGLGCCGG